MQANLITLMFAGVDASLLAGVPTDAQPSMLPGQADFMLTLQQQLLAASLPQAGLAVDAQTETPAQDFSALLLPAKATFEGEPATSDQVPAKLQSQVLDEPGLLRTADAARPQAGVATAEQVTFKPAPELSLPQLFAALTEVLRSILDGGLTTKSDVTAQPEAGTVNTPVASSLGDTAAPLLTASSEATELSATRVVPEVIAQELLPEVRSLFIKLSQQWPQVARQLERLVTGTAQAEVQVELAEPRMVSDVRPQVLPWADQMATDQPLDAQATKPQTDVLGGLPFKAPVMPIAASVRWFVEQGILSTEPQAQSAAPIVSQGIPPSTGGQAVTAAPVTTELPVPVPVIAVQPLLASEVKLNDGSTVRVALLPMAPRADGAQQFTLQVSLPEPELGTLSATLTVRRVDAPAPTLLPQVDLAASLVPEPPKAVVAPAVQLSTTQPVVQTQVVVSTPLVESPEAITVANPGVTRVAAEPLPLTHSGNTAISIGDVETKLAPQPQLNLSAAVVAETAQTQVPVSLTGPAVVKTTAPAVRLGAEQPTAVTVNPELREESAVPEFLVSSTRERPASVFDILSRAVVQRPQAGNPPADPVPGSATVATTVDSIVAATIADVTSARVEPQLMQFQTGGLEYMSSQLNYLELMQQVMGEASRARAAGNGLYHARLDLNPPNLGRMYVNISVRGDTVSLQLAVVSGVPKEQLKDSLAALRESLEEAGLHVAELKIVTMEPEKDDNGNQDGQSGQQPEDNSHGSKQTSPWHTNDPERPVAKSVPVVRT